MLFLSTFVSEQMGHVDMLTDQLLTLTWKAEVLFLSTFVSERTGYVDSDQLLTLTMQSGNAAALIICFRADGACRHFDFDQLVTMTCKAEMLLLSSTISELMGHVNMLHLQQPCMLLTTRRSILSQMGLLFGCTGIPPVKKQKR